MKTIHHLAAPTRRGRGRRTKATLAAILLLILVAATLTGCSANPAAAVAPSPTSSAAPSPSPSPSPTRTAVPALPTATLTATSTPLPPSPTPTWTVTATSTPSPSPTLTPSATPTPTSTPEPTPTPQPTPTSVPTAILSEDIMHILLIGGDTDYMPDMNTDALIIIVVNRETKQVSLLSIPRDLWVYIPDYGWGRINSAHRIGTRFKYEGFGPGLLKRTIEENLGIPIDHWIRISHRGFANMVDELGGVDMIVPCRINLRYHPPTSEGEEEMILEPGSYHFDGATALRYVRTRRDSSDFDRSRRQQQFLRAVWDQFRSPDIIAQIPELWPALKAHFKTSLKLSDILALAPLALDLQPQRIRSRYIGKGQTQGWTTPEGWYVLAPIPEKVQQVVDSLYAPPSASSDRAANEAARVQVQNGTGRGHLARIGAEQLRWAGLQVVETGLADRSDYAKTQIVVFNDKPETLAVLTRLLGVKPEQIIHQPDPSQAADIRVILGQDYDPCR